MYDGYAKLKVNGEKSQVEDIHFFDLRLSDIDFDIVAEQITDQIELQEDALLMVFFKYSCEQCGNPMDGYEYEDVVEVLDTKVLLHNYKEFSRHQISLEVGVAGGMEVLNSDTEDRNYYRELVGDWEEFYEEDFVLFEKVVVYKGVPLNEMEQIENVFDIGEEG